jgi:hypothetical protein
MLRDLLTQKCVQKFWVTDFGYPRAYRFRKHQILNRSPELPLPTFKKRDFYFINVGKIGKNGPKMEFFEFFEISLFFNVIVQKLFLCVPRLEKRENSRKKFENRSILAIFLAHFSHIL